MLGKTSYYSFDVSGNDRHFLLFYKKCHFWLEQIYFIGDEYDYKWLLNGKFCSF